MADSTMTLADFSALWEGNKHDRISLGF